MYKGIDISKYQGIVDFSKVKQAMDFVIVRAGYTGYGTGEFVVDPYFKINAEGCKSVGIPFGAYWFSQAVNVEEAIKEADIIIELVKPYGPEYPIFIDTELSGAPNNAGRADNLNVEVRTSVVEAFCKRIEEHGYYAGYYCSRSWSTSKLNAKRMSKYDLWLADWTNYGDGFKPVTANSYGIWQYTSSGTCPGINGRVDLNYSYKDYPYIIANAGLNGFTDKPEQIEFSDVIIKDITNGDVEKFKDLAESLEVSDNLEVVKG